jgi:hypothetical protein
MTDLLSIDKSSPECCTINTKEHIKNSLGNPIKLPECLEEKISEDWAINAEDNLLTLFELMTGEEYEQKTRDNTYNWENDLSDFFVFTVYAPINSADYVWADNIFVVVEIGAGGDPRYCSYSGAEIYRVNSLGDSGFFDLTLGWWAENISENANDLDDFNDKLCSGYSFNPYNEMSKMLFSEPVWSEKRQCFIGRFRNFSHPVKLMPITPYYDN